MVWLILIFINCVVLLFIDKVFIVFFILVFWMMNCKVSISNSVIFKMMSWILVIVIGFKLYLIVWMVCGNVLVFVLIRYIILYFKRKEILIVVINVVILVDFFSGW